MTPRRRIARPRTRFGRDGFMIVEALSALALGALILLAIGAFTGMMRRSADRAAAQVETLEVSGRTILTIANEVRRATRRRWAAPPESEVAQADAPAVRRPPTGQSDQSQTGRGRPGSDAGEDGGVTQRRGGEETAEGETQQGLDEAQRKRPFVFSGTPDRLLFALAPEQADGLRADVIVAWQLDESGAALRAEAPLPGRALGPEDVTLGPVARVAPGPERLRFAFVSRSETGEEIITDAWSETSRMPAAVRIDRLDPGSLAVIGSLRVPIELDGEPGCADPAKGFCSREAAGGPGGAGGRGRPDPARQSDGQEPG